MGSLMPGSFSTGTEASTVSSSQAVVNKWNTLSVEEDKLTAFNKSEYLVTKAKGQRHMLTQLQGCVYILMGYQLVKFCHMACLLPFLLDLMALSMISVKAIVEPGNWSLLETINEATTRREQESGENQANMRSNATKMICLSLYGKFLLVVLYHALFALWIKSIADQGALKDLINGSWWLVSFIGESVEQNYDISASLWLKLWQLGLYQLIITDLVITLIQLVLFQSVHKQSSKSLEGLPLNIDESETVRPANVRVSGDTLHQLPEDSIPNILNVRLHDCLSRQSYLGFE
ncbi:hypothetical protein FDK38_003039 [Candidozyma auris]|nr:hypothetical protein FDK38_003039 [[Candida] auris]